MNEYSQPQAAFPPPQNPYLPLPSKFPVQASTAKSVLRMSAGTVSIAAGFWGGSAALALLSMSDYLGPRFAWLGACVGFAALFSVATGFVQIVRHRVRDLRLPALSMAFAAIGVLSYVAVYIALPVVSPMLGGLIVSALAVIMIAMTTVFDTPVPATR